ncbi:hypothetical protein CPB97_004420 [Podila verticillata]|nr:hypothetical protein CPB97_004420 [Podila verticillata]
MYVSFDWAAVMIGKRLFFDIVLSTSPDWCTYGSEGADIQSRNNIDTLGRSHEGHPFGQCFQHFDVDGNFM